MDQGEYEASLPPVPERLTVVMINTFVAQTTQLLNRLSETCETKLADAQRRIDSMDVTLKILEAKINSVEGLDAAPAAVASTSGASCTSQDAPGRQAGTAAAASGRDGSGSARDAEVGGVGQGADDTGAVVGASTPRPPPSGVETVEATGGGEEGADADAPTPSAPPAAQTGMTLKDHPDYARYFKMVRMGVPAQAVKNKMMLEGFTPEQADVIDTPDAPAS